MSFSVTAVSGTGGALAIALNVPMPPGALIIRRRANDSMLGSSGGKQKGKAPK
jgi:hypothetical protein